MKYLMYCGSTATILDIPAEFTSDQYGELRDRFESQYGNKHDWVNMRRLDLHNVAFGVHYDWELAGPDGASFEVYAFPETPKDDVKQAVEKLHRDQDVVRLRVIKFKALVEFSLVA